MTNMTNLFNQFSPNFRRVIQQAAWICLNLEAKTILPVHLLIAIVFVPDSLAAEMLNKMGIKLDNLEKSFNIKIDSLEKSLAALNPDLAAQKVFNLSMSKEVIQILENAALLALKYQYNYIGTEHLLAALLAEKNEEIKQEFKKLNLPLADLEMKLLELIKKAPRHLDANYVVHKTKIAKKDKFFNKSIYKTPALDYFCQELTAVKFQKKLDPIIGRHDEIQRMINILSRRTKNNPILLGDPGVGKTAIVEGLAQLIFQEKAPDLLLTKRIFTVDLSAVVAGTIYRGEFESRLKQIIEEASRNKDIILFIDEIHNLIGAGSASGSLDAANILKPSLARGEITCIGATTMDEYKKHFEGDAALERRFQPIIISEPSAADTILVLNGLKSNLEKYHSVKIAPEAIKEAVYLSGRYLPEKHFPDKAIDLLDETLARLKVQWAKDNFSKKIKHISRQIYQTGQLKEKALAKSDWRAATAFKKTENQLLVEMDRVEKYKKQAGKKILTTLNKADILQVVREITKIPFLEIGKINRQKLLDLEKILSQKIIGQNKALKQIAGALRRSEAGLADPNRPLASFIFLGPSGVGKTETAKVIAEEIFGSREALIRIDMSEFAESFNMSKLIGSPAGYVGYKDPNLLADKIRQRPYSVVLFDEMEKAHRDVFNLLLQILEDGFLTDAVGKKINFKNTVIIFTSNIGLASLNKTANLGFAVREESKKQKLARQFAELKDKIIKELYSEFKIEFLNRIDKIIFFEPLNQAAIAKIIALKMKELNQRLADRKIKIDFTPTTMKYLTKASFSPDQGARSIRKIIEEKVEELLVEKILQEEIHEGQAVKVDIEGAKVVLR